MIKQNGNEPYIQESTRKPCLKNFRSRGLRGLGLFACKTAIVLNFYESAPFAITSNTLCASDSCVPLFNRGNLRLQQVRDIFDAK